jgi:hypothetical protein
MDCVVDKTKRATAEKAVNGVFIEEFGWGGWVERREIESVDGGSEKVEK